MTEHWDATGCCWLGSVGKSGLKEEIWVDQNIEVLRLVLSTSDAMKIIGAKNEEDVGDELKSVCCSSSLGINIFGATLSRLAVKSYVGEILKMCNEVFVEQITQDELAFAHARAAKAAESWEYDKRCQAKSFVQSTLIDVEVDLLVVDALSVATSVIFLFIKQKGLATGQITPLWFEAAIWKFSQEPEVTPRPTIAAEILKPVNLMRKILNEEVASSPPGSGN